MNWSGLRIAIVGPLPPPAGGMANQTRQLAELLEGEGASVELVQVNAPYRPEWAGRVKGVRALVRLVPYLARLWRVSGRVDLVHVMANSGWSWHLFSAPAIWLASLRGRAVVVNYRGGEAARFLARNARWVRPTLGRASALVLPSGFLLEVFAGFGMHGRVVPNIINADRFQPDLQRSRNPREPQLVVARNLEHLYGNDLALKAFARIVAEVPGARLTIAGSGPEHGRLRQLAHELGVAPKVHFTGRLDRDQMADLYRNADIMLNPTRVDNMPNSILEALASGLPVVCSSVGGVPYMVDDGRTALLVPTEDPEALANAVLRLIADPELAQRLIDNGLAEVRRYRWDAVRDTLAAAYQDAMRCAPAPEVSR